MVEVDAVYVKPFKTDTILIAPGQTTNVLLTTSKSAGKYLVTASPFMDSPIAVDNVTATATVHYSGTLSSSPTTLTLPPPQNATTIANNFTNSLRSLNSKKYPALVPTTIDHHLFFTVGLGLNPCPTCKAGNGSRVVASINNVTFTMPKTALLPAHYFNISGVFTTDFPKNPPHVFNYSGGSVTNMATETGTRLYKLPYNATVQLVLQDTGRKGSIAQTHYELGRYLLSVGKTEKGELEMETVRQLLDIPRNFSAILPDEGRSADHDGQ